MTCWTTFVFMSMLKSDICQMSSVKCQVSSVKCHISSVKWQVSNVKCQMSKWLCLCMTCHVKCLCWSLGHAEQLLFSCLCSKVAYVKCQVSSVKCLMQVPRQTTLFPIFVYFSNILIFVYYDKFLSKFSFPYSHSQFLYFFNILFLVKL